MAKPDLSALLPLFDRAIEEEIGIAFALSGCTRVYFRNMLYDARKTYKDTHFSDGDKYDVIMIFLPNNDEVWLCKKTVSIDE